MSGIEDEDIPGSYFCSYTVHYLDIGNIRAKDQAFDIFADGRYCFFGLLQRRDGTADQNKPPSTGDSKSYSRFTTNDTSLYNRPVSLGSDLCERVERLTAPVMMTVLPELASSARFGEIAA